MAKKKKLPPVHPGEVLREDYLVPAGVTVNALALALRVPVSRMYEIVNCTRAITPETALRLARHLGTSPERATSTAGKLVHHFAIEPTG